MSVSIEDVDKIAQLAKLKFNKDEKEKLQHDLNRILEYIDQLNELELDNVTALENINETENEMREDKVSKSLNQETYLSNAPSRTGKFFKVPKVIDK